MLKHSSYYIICRVRESVPPHRASRPPRQPKRAEVRLVYVGKGEGRVTRSRAYSRLDLSTTGPFNREVEGLGITPSPRSNPV